MLETPKISLTVGRDPVESRVDTWLKRMIRRTDREYGTVQYLH